MNDYKTMALMGACVAGVFGIAYAVTRSKSAAEKDDVEQEVRVVRYFHPAHGPVLDDYREEDMPRRILVLDMLAGEEALAAQRDLSNAISYNRANAIWRWDSIPLIRRK